MKSKLPYQELVKILPLPFQQTLAELKVERDDKKVSVKQWHDKSDQMLRDATALTKAQKQTLNQCVKLLAKEERRSKKNGSTEIVKVDKVKKRSGNPAVKFGKESAK
jgi:hypothetical protein